MNPFQKTIFTGFSPNITWRDTCIALSYICFPWKWLQWKEGKYNQIVEKKLETYFGSNTSATTFDSGRNALLVALQALGVKKEDEVIVQAYTCVVVSNAIIWAGATPIYVDIKDDFNMNIEELKKKITNKTKVIIAQHTFGTPADIDSIISIAKEHNIPVVEDCAHSLGAKHNEKLLGMFGDIGMFSFGSDKIISCARGGALITQSNELAEKIKQIQKSAGHLPTQIILQHLLHYPTFLKGRTMYRIGVGKVILYFGKRFSILNKIITKGEKQGKKPNYYPSKLPNALGHILSLQLNDLERVNKHRLNIANIYQKELGMKSLQESIYLRFPLLVQDPKRMLSEAKKRDILLGSWYSTPIAPMDSSNQSITGYKMGNCPNAEKLGQQSINLPTNRHITRRDALRIVTFIKQYV